MGAGRLGNPGMGTPGMRLDSGTFQLRTCRRFSTIKMKTYLLTRRGKRGPGEGAVSFGFLCWAPFWGKGPKKQGKRCIEYFLGPNGPFPRSRAPAKRTSWGGGETKVFKGHRDKTASPPPRPNPAHPQPESLGVPQLPGRKRSFLIPPPRSTRTERDRTGRTEGTDGRDGRTGRDAGQDTRGQDRTGRTDGRKDGTRWGK